MMGLKVSFRQKLKSRLRIKNKLVREGFAEFLGTFILVVIGDGSVAQKVFGRDAYGEWLSVNWSWAIGVALGVWISGGISGGHINPAVSLSMSILGRLPWYKFPVYLMAQYLGAIAGAACVFGVYHDAHNEFDGGNRTVGGPLDTAGIYCTYPKDYLSWHNGFGDQIFATGILVMCILALTDERNMAPPKGLLPFCVGLIVFVLGSAFGLNSGYAINPARDLGPRIFTAMAGWGTEVFSYRDYNWFWIPVVGPHIGAILGAWVYILLISNHHPDEPDVDYEVNSNHGDGKELGIKGESNSGFIDDSVIISENSKF